MNVSVFWLILSFESNFLLKIFNTTYLNTSLYFGSPNENVSNFPFKKLETIWWMLFSHTEMPLKIYKIILSQQKICHLCTLLHVRYFYTHFKNYCYQPRDTNTKAIRALFFLLQLVLNELWKQKIKLQTNIWTVIIFSSRYLYVWIASFPS